MILCNNPWIAHISGHTKPNGGDMGLKSFKRLWQLFVVGLVALMMAGTGATVYAQALDPASVEATLPPGGSTVVIKTVTTPVIPPRPDICFLADTTASMGAALANVQANATSIMNMVAAVQPDAQFCAAQYRDTGDSPDFQVDQTITATIAAVQAAINTWTPGGGGDTPEGQLHALTLLATAAGFRSDSTRIIVWFGDASGHDPSIGGETLASTIAALTTAGIRVIAVPVTTGSGDGLDNPASESGVAQASAIAGATGGLVIPAGSPEDVSAAILAGLTNLPVDVSMASGCDVATGGDITVSFAPPIQTVTSGDVAVFTETINVSAGAVQGSTYVCDDNALLNGMVMTDASGNTILEVKTIHVTDITPPVAQCVQTTNPSGGNVPPAGTGTGNSGQNPDGFYQLLGSDNVAVASIVVCDSGSSFCSDPFADGDQVKITQAPGATPSDSRPGPGVIVSHLKLNGDAILRVTDTSGLVTEVSCLVPPPPK